jgi:uncharacterized protein YacL
MEITKLNLFLVIFITLFIFCIPMFRLFYFIFSTKTRQNKIVNCFILLASYVGSFFIVKQIYHYIKSKVSNIDIETILKNFFGNNFEFLLKVFFYIVLGIALDFIINTILNICINSHIKKMKKKEEIRLKREFEKRKAEKNIDDFKKYNIE